MTAGDLAEWLDRLVAFFSECFESASWQRILLVESKMTHDDPQYQIARAALFTPKKYSDRFSWLLAQGYSWINLQAAGVFNGTLLIVVELPNYKSNVPNTAINISGPYLIKEKESWDISDKVMIID